MSCAELSDDITDLILAMDRNGLSIRKTVIEKLRELNVLMRNEWNNPAQFENMEDYANSCEV